jgi:hypothetical protein
MRLSIEIALLLAATCAHAFDSASWLGQRALLDREAERLRAEYPKFLGRVTEPAENVVIPVESHPDGSVKTSVFAARARIFLQEGFVWAEGVEIRQLRPDGSVESSIEAENCLVDRSTKSGWTEGRARARYRGDAELEGENVYFSAAEEYVKIFTNTVLRADGRVLMSVRADYDRGAGVAMFDGDVRLHGSERRREYDLSSSQAFAFIAGTNDFRRVVALGGVRVVSDGRTGECDRAVYTRRDSRVVMYGEEGGAPARLADGGGRGGAVEGARITFWLDSEEVEVVDSAVTMDAGRIKVPIGPGGGT